MNVGKAEVAIKAQSQAIIRPTDRATVIHKGSGGLEVADLCLGLITSWAKDPNIGVQCINARAETISDKPSFREAFQKRLCLIPADGFWETEYLRSKSLVWREAVASAVQQAIAYKPEPPTNDGGQFIPTPQSRLRN